MKETLQEPQLLDLHQKFPPRFFGIRPDLSTTEFLRPDVLHLTPEDFQYPKLEVVHPSEEIIKTNTVFKSDGAVKLYQEYEALSKQNRSALLKNLHIPKPKKVSGNKKQEVVVEDFVQKANEIAEESQIVHAQYLELITDILADDEKEHHFALHPIQPPPPVEPPMPPFTPSPKLLQAQQNIYSKKVKSDKILKFWNTHEADFSFPLHSETPSQKPLSPRVFLNDPPRFSKSHPDPYPNTPPSHSQTLQRELTPQVEEEQNFQRFVNFGQVKIGQEKVLTISITFTTKDPQHFTFTLPGDPSIKILTHPGTIIPNLPLKLKFLLRGDGEARTIDTFIKLNTRKFSLNIKIEGALIE